MIGDTLNERLHRALQYQRQGGPKVGRVPIVDADLRRWVQDHEAEAGRPEWTHDGYRFEVVGWEPVRSSEGVHFLIVTPIDGGPHG